MNSEQATGLNIRQKESLPAETLKPEMLNICSNTSPKPQVTLLSSGFMAAQ